MSDRADVDAFVVANGDLRFGELYDRYHRPIRDYCRRRVPAAAVDDAVADVFLVVWRRLGDVPSGDVARLWLCRVAHRTVGHEWRRQRHRRRLDDRVRSVFRPSATGPDETVIERDDHRRVLAAAARLSTTDAEVRVLRLVVWDGLSLAEAAPGESP